MVFTAIMAAVICVAAPFSVPTPWLVPITLATFAVYLAGALLGSKRAVIAVVVYILLGAVGLPVFSGFTGGFAKLLGVTGGYIIGYVPCALLTGIFSERFNKLWALPVGMVLGTVACYAFGTAWYMIATGTELIPALMGCVLPFLAGDAVKIVVVTAVAFPIKARLGHLLGESV
jgi:biotin transport system substrate-specific component